MLKWEESELTKIDANITTKEIIQQPELWEETYNIFEEHKEALGKFLADFQEQSEEKIRVVFTGAGTSAYVGDVLRPYLIKNGDNVHYQFEAIPTTDIVAVPYDYLREEIPTLLVSFARSGNSPESVAAVDLANKVVKQVRHLVITCAQDGQLAQISREDANSFVLLMPARSNDKGFAMTGSFSCMTLSSLLIFDKEHTNKKEIVEGIIQMGGQAIELEERIQKLVDLNAKRIVYLGSGSLAGLTREAQLKLLELTAGEVTTAFDSSMGFRHGPKSFVNNETVVFDFVSNDAYTRDYDVDILEEIKGNQIAIGVIAIAQNESRFSGDSLLLNNALEIPDGYLALPYVMVAQIFALLTSVKVGNKPDTPSPTGTVNRVVKGVVIHPL